MESNKLFSPEIGARISAYITSVDTTSRVLKLWAQVDQEKALSLENAMENLQQSLEASDKSLEFGSLQVGDICCAKFQQDARWYRARVVSKCPGDVKGDGTVTVLFVDYGNIEVVDISKLRTCPAEVACIPAQASECVCSGVEAAGQGLWSKEAASFLAEQADTEVSMEVVKVVYDKSIVVEAFQGSAGGGQSLSQLLLQKGWACPSTNVQQSFKTLALPLGARERIYLSHIISPHQFWIQLHSHTDDISELMEGILAHTPELNTPASVLRDIQTGAICAALSSDEDVYYRGIVRSIMDDNTADVYFVDYGHSQKTPHSDIKCLRPEFTVLPAQAVECSLKDIEPNTEWTEEAREYFELVTLDKELVGEVTGKSSEGKMYLQLKERRGGLTLDIRDMLIKEGYASSTKVDSVVGGKRSMELTDKSSPLSASEQMATAGFNHADAISTSTMNGYLSVEKENVPTCSMNPSSSVTSPKHKSSRLQYKLPPYPPGSTLDGQVLSVVNIGQFFCSPVEESSELMELMDKLHEYCSQTDVASLKDPRPGMVCCGQFSEDDGWYRAVVCKVKDDKVFVRYVDYGNCEFIEKSKVKVLTPEFADLPPQCLEACLIDVVPTKSTLAPEVTQHFVNLVKDGSFKIKLFSRDQSGRYTVDLMKEKQTLSQAMKGFMRDRAISTKSPPPSPGVHVTDLEYIQPFVEEGTYQEIFVTDASDPDVFWCQLLSSAEELTSLMEDMNNYYSQLNQEEEALHTCGLGVPCVANYSIDEQWYRAVITGVLKSGDVEVRFVDYGNVDLVSRVSVKAIKPKYMQLPVQAIQCSLLGVLCKNDLWTERQMQQFSQMVLEKEFVAQIVAMEEMENRCEIELFDHRGKNVNNEYGRVTQTLASKRDYVKPPPKELPPCPVPGATATAISKGYVVPMQMEKTEKKMATEKLEPSPSSHTCGDSLLLKQETEKTMQAASDSGGSTDSTSSTRSQQSVYFTAPSSLTADSRSSSCVSLASGSSSSRKGSIDASTLCLYPGFDQLPIKKGAVEKLALTHTITPSQFFCQLSRHFPDVEDLSEKLQQYYSSADGKEAFISDPEVGMPCCALYSEDSEWYRATITDVLEQEVEVKFVDFGNTEMLDLGDIRVLEEDFAAPPAFAVECSAAHIKPTSGTWSVKAVEKFFSLTEGKTLVGKIVNVSTRGKVMLELRDGEKGTEQLSFNQELVQAGFARESTPSVSSHSSTPAGSQAGTPTSSRPGTPGTVEQVKVPLSSLATPDKVVYKALPLAGGCTVDVMVSFLVSPNEFWCQPIHTYDELNNLMEDLRAFYTKDVSGDNAVVNPTVGQACAAQFSEDNEWYRAKITKVIGQEVEVSYVDYGNSEKRLATGLRLLEPSFTKLPPQAFKCSLQEKVLPPGGEAWDNKSISHLQRLVIDKELKCIISGRKTGEEDTFHLTDLTCKQHISIPQKMIEAQLARPTKSRLDRAPTIEKEASSYPVVQPDPEVKVGLSAEAVVSFGDDPLNFWCQRTSQGSKLDELMDAIDAHCSSNDAEDVGKLKSGQAVIAKYSVDQGWYRAEVKEAVSPRQYILHFVDYGNQEQVSKSNMKVLKPEFAVLPKQAFSCCLSKLEGVTPEAKVKFAELSSEVQLKLTVVDKKQKHYEVELENPETAMQINQEILNMTTTVSLAAQHSSTTSQASKPDYQKPQQEIERETSSSLSTSNKAKPVSQLFTSALKYPPATIQVDSSVAVYISHCETPTKFWVQLADQEPQLNTLMDALETSAQDCKPLASAAQLSVGDPCCAQFSEDCSWYRGRITDVSQKGKLGVLFVDYGNQEMVPLEKIRELQADMVKQPPFATECVLDGRKPTGAVWSSVACSWFKEVTVERVLQAEFLNSVEPVRVKLSDGSEDIGENMVKKGHAVQASGVNTGTSDIAVNRTVAEVSSGSLPLISEVDLAKGTDVEVYVAVTLSPSNFWCQLASTAAELDSLMEKINAYCTAINNKEILKSPHLGMSCIAQFSEDKGWYRAKVINLEEDGVEVIFVDYGNSEKVDRSLVKVIKPEFTELPMQAFQCGLADVTTPSGGWSSDTTAKFTQLATAQEDPYVIRVVAKDGSGLYTVELATSDEAMKKSDTIGKQLLGKELAKPADMQGMGGDGSTQESSTKPQDSIPGEEATLCYSTDIVKAGDKLNVYITFMDKSNHIWCQKTDNSKVLEELMDTVHAYCTNLKDEEDTVHMPQQQMACLAQYSEDGGWYRAKVVEVKEGSMSVQFVDYGNTEEVASSKVKQIKSEFLKLPELAFECRLQNVPVPWEASLVKLFSNLTNDKALVVDVQDVTKQDKKQVLEISLLDGDLSVNEALIQERQQPVETKAFKPPEISVGETHSAYISSVVDPTKFYIQMEGSEAVIEELMEKVQHCEQLASPSLDVLQADTPVLAMYTVDDQWYRAQVLSLEGKVVKVLYVDFGNSETVGLERLKCMSPDFLVTPVQAVECALDTEVNDLPEESTTVLQGLTEILSIKFLHREGQKWVVEAFQGETSVKVMVMKAGKEETIKTSTPSKDETGDNLQGVDPELSVIESLPQPANFVYAANDIDEGELQQGYVSHTTSPSQFFIQLAASAGKLDTMMKEINEEYGSLGTRDREVTDIKPGMPCIVPLSEEGEEVWYRGRVQFTNHSVSIYYIDYGNEGVVPAECVKKIPPKFMTLPGQAIACSLSDVCIANGSLPEGANEKFLELTEERQLTVEFNNRHGSGWNVRLLDGEESIGPKLTPGEFSKESQTVQTTSAVKQNETPDSGLDETVSSDVKAESPNLVIPALQIEPGTEETVYYLCGESPDHFYCQLARSDTQQNKLAEDITNHCTSSVESLSTPVEGQSCLAQFLEDDQWYRAVVIAVTLQDFHVRFVDYGNSEVVPCAKLRPLPQEMAQVPAQAITCRLAALAPMDDKWTDPTFHAFQDMCAERELNAKFESRHDDKFGVVLHDQSGGEASSINQKMISLGHAKAPPSADEAPPVQYKKPLLSRSEEVELYFLSAEDPDNMVLQLVQSEQDLNKLAENIGNVYDKLGETELKMKEMSPGTVCCAKFSDGLWYRAEVVSADSDQVTVYFVDYGNTETVDVRDVRDLLPELATLPTQALHCGIFGIEAPSETWSCQMKEALEELCSSGGVVKGVVATMETDGKILLGSCTIEGVDIVQQLLDRRLAVKEGEVSEGSEVSVEPQDSEAFLTASQDTEESCGVSEEGSIRLAAREVRAGDQLNVVVTNVETPDRFWCQDVEANLPRINAYCELCQDTLQSPKVNDLCCALFSEDQGWYRAKILDVVSSKMLTVQFVDFGSLETISPVNTRPLEPEMAALPPCALQCGMSDIQGRTAETGDWTSEAVLYFEDLVQDKTFRLLVNEVTPEGGAQVELYSECEEKTVSQLMVVSGHARRKAGSIQSGSMDSLSGYTGTSTAESASPAPGSEAEEHMEKDSEETVQPVEQVEQPEVMDTTEMEEQTQEVMQSPAAVGADVDLQSSAAVEADVELQSPAAVEAVVDLQSSAAVDSDVDLQGPAATEADVDLQTPAAVEADVDLRGPAAVEADVELQSSAAAEADVDLQTPAAVEADVDLQGPAAVEDDLELQSPSAVQADVDLQSSAAVEADVELQSSAAVEADVDLQSSAAVEADIELQSPAAVEADIELQSPAAVEADIELQSTDAVDADVELQSSAAVEADVDLQSPAAVEADIELHSSAAVEADVDLQSSAAVEADVDLQRPAAVEADIELQSPAAVEDDLELQSPAAVEADVDLLSSAAVESSEMGSVEDIVQTPPDAASSCETPVNRQQTSVSSFYTPVGEVSLSFATDKALSPSSVLEVTGSEWTTFEETVGSSPESTSQDDDDPAREKAAPADEELPTELSSTMSSSSCDTKAAGIVTSCEMGTLSDMNGIADPSTGKEIGTNKQELQTNGDVEQIGEEVYHV